MAKFTKEQVDHSEQRNERFRGLLLKNHPEWKKRVRIYRDCVGISGLGTVWYRTPDAPVEQEAEQFIKEFEWLTENG